MGERLRAATLAQPPRSVLPPLPERSDPAAANEQCSAAPHSSAASSHPPCRSETTVFFLLPGGDSGTKSEVAEQSPVSQTRSQSLAQGSWSAPGPPAGAASNPSVPRVPGAPFSASTGSSGFKATPRRLLRPTHAWGQARGKDRGKDCRGVLQGTAGHLPTLGTAQRPSTPAGSEATPPPQPNSRAAAPHSSAASSHPPGGAKRTRRRKQTVALGSVTGPSSTGIGLTGSIGFYCICSHLLVEFSSFGLGPLGSTAFFRIFWLGSHRSG